MKRLTTLLILISGVLLLGTDFTIAEQKLGEFRDLKPLFEATTTRLQSFHIDPEYVCERVRGADYSQFLNLPEKMKAHAARVLGLNAWDQDRGKPIERPSFQFLILHPEVNRFSVTNYQIAPDETKTGNPPHIAKAEVLLFDLDGKLVCRTEIPRRPGRPLVSEDRVIAMIAEWQSTDQSLASIFYIHHLGLGPQGMIDGISFNGELLLLDQQGQIRKSLSPAVTWSSCQVSPDGHYLAFLDGQAVRVDYAEGTWDYSKLGCILVDETGAIRFFKPRYAHAERMTSAALGYAELAPGWPKETSPDPLTPRPVHVDCQGRVVMYGSISFWIYDRTGKLIHKVPSEVYTGIPYRIANQDTCILGHSLGLGLTVLDKKEGRLLLKNAEIKCMSPAFNPGTIGVDGQP